MLVQNRNSLEISKDSSAIAEINTIYTKAQQDIPLTTDDTLGNNSIKSILYELRGWSDVGQERYQSNCSPPSKDIWVHHERNCPTGYKIGDVLGAKSCLLIPEFNRRQAVYRYSTQTECKIKGSNDFTSIGEAVGRYIDNLNTYITDSNDLLENLKNNNISLNTKFVEISQKIFTILQNMDGVIDPLVDIYGNVLGKSEFYDFLNCCKYFLFIILAIMKTGLFNVYSELEDNLSPYSFSLGGIIIAVSILQYISVICLFILTNKYKDLSRKDGSGIILEAKE